MTDEVRFITSWISVSDESIVDFGIGTPADQAAAASRLEEERQRSDAAWRALPAHVRLSRIVRARRWDLAERICSTIHRRLFPECDR